MDVKKSIITIILLFMFVAFQLFSCKNSSSPLDKNNLDNKDSVIIISADSANILRGKRNNDLVVPHSDSLKMKLDTTQNIPYEKYHKITFDKPHKSDSIIKLDKIKVKAAAPDVKYHEITFDKHRKHYDSLISPDTFKQISSPIENADIKPNTIKHSAILGYSFFKNIKQHDTRNINAFVSIIKAVGKVVNTLKDINANDIPQKANDTATILTRNILVYKALDIQLLNAGDSDFIIKQLYDNRQLIDSLEGNLWTWSVTPRTYKANGRLIMKITAEKSNGSRDPLPVINIPISIIIDKSIGRNIWEWMMDNPEKVITIILIPLIAFFRKEIVGLFKKKTENKS